MLISGSHLINCPILSLHIGGSIARVTEPVIDPNNLKLIAVRVDGPLVTKDTGDILPIESVREFSRAGMIVDSIDELVDGDDIIRIQSILKLNFALPGLKVITKKKVKLGKVSDFILNTSSWQVHQVIVQRPFVKALLDPELTISRQSIVEVNDYQIIVKDEHEKAKKTVAAVAPTELTPNFINPFRKPDFAPESRTKD